jgi:hypothetical protein
VKKIFLLCAVAGLIAGSIGVYAEEPDLLITDFEKHPNALGGEMGLYGAGEPDWKNKTQPYSWYYTPEVKGYKKENIISGQQSFRLVNGNGPISNVGWASFGMDMGPVTGPEAMPVKIRPLDVSGYKYLSFWAKGEKGGEKLRVIFRDASATTYMPEHLYDIKEPLTVEWKRIVIPLNEIEGVDFKNLVHIGISFGEDIGNKLGTIIYLDDFAFTNYISLQ